MSTYKYKGAIYIPVGRGKIKHPENGEWMEAMIYKNNKGEIFARELQDFKSKFEKFCNCLRHKKCTDNLDTCPLI